MTNMASMEALAARISLFKLVYPLLCLHFIASWVTSLSPPLSAFFFFSFSFSSSHFFFLPSFSPSLSPHSLSPSPQLFPSISLPTPPCHFIPRGLSRCCSQDSPTSYLAAGVTRQEARLSDQLGLSRELAGAGPLISYCIGQAVTGL